jgi:hypothetical protein
VWLMKTCSKWQKNQKPKVKEGGWRDGTFETGVGWKRDKGRGMLQKLAASPRWTSDGDPTTEVDDGLWTERVGAGVVAGVGVGVGVGVGAVRCGAGERMVVCV